MVFALLLDKARTTYNRMFNAIKGIQSNLAPDTMMAPDTVMAPDTMMTPDTMMAPDTMMVDLELTLHGSISDTFPAKY